MAGPLTPHTIAAAPVLTSGNRTLVWIIAVVALAALVLAAALVRQVLASDEGTDGMKKIAAAVQEGANAYLARQFRTLAIFAVAAPVPSVATKAVADARIASRFSSLRGRAMLEPSE